MRKNVINSDEYRNLLTRRQVSDLLSIDLSTVHNWTKKGILPAYRLGGRVYFKLSDIENNLDRIPNLKEGRAD